MRPLQGARNPHMAKPSIQPVKLPAVFFTTQRSTLHPHAHLQHLSQQAHALVTCRYALPAARFTTQRSTLYTRTHTNEKSLTTGTLAHRSRVVLLACTPLMAHMAHTQTNKNLPRTICTTQRSALQINARTRTLSKHTHAPRQFLGANAANMSCRWNHF